MGTTLKFAMALAAATALMAQPQQQITRPIARSDWARVGQIQPNQKIKVYLADGTTLRGTFRESGPEGLALLLAGKPPSVRNVGRDEILRIGRNSRGRGVMMGAATGGAIGVGLGAAFASKGIQHDLQASRAAIAAWFGSLFAAVGSGLGAAFGDELTIYEAPRPRVQARR